MLPFHGRDELAPLWHHVHMQLFWVLASVFLTGCEPIRAFVVSHYPSNYEPAAMGAVKRNTHWSEGVPGFTLNDEQREQVSVALTPVLKGLSQPTDMTFFPGSQSTGLILEKEGRLSRFDLNAGSTETIQEFDVLTHSEQGLLGVALHPKFGENGKLYLHQSVEVSGENVGEISSWRLDGVTLTQLGIVLGVPQPYPNHNAGQIVFGDDGMLYVGMGDGGWRNDPHDHGQNGATLLGSLLRLDVDTTDNGYAIPRDNPFIDHPTVAPEAWVIGVRNPWKFSFAPDGRAIVADVGQNAFEEVSLATAGDNLGWKTREARHCFPSGSSCEQAGLVDPIFEYAHKEGQSITGGFVATSDRITQIKDHYVFGDFVSGRLWAIPLPQDRTGAMVDAKALGQWPFLPSTFGRSADGTLFVADFGKGLVYRIDPA